MQSNDLQVKAKAAIALAIVLFAVLCGVIIAIVNDFYHQDVTDTETTVQMTQESQSTTQTTVKDTRPIPSK